METVFVLTACLLPCLLYISAGMFILVKRRAGEDGSCEARPKVLRDLAVIVFLIALCFLSVGIYAFCAKDVAFGNVADYVVMKLYSVSSLIPCILVKRYAYGRVCGQCFYIPVILVSVLLLVADIMLYSGYWGMYGSIVLRCTVLVVFAVFCYVTYISSVFGTELLHDGKSRLGMELYMHLFVMSFYSFLILAYSFSIHKVFDYFIVVTGFAVVHSLMAIAFINGRALSSLIVRNTYIDAGPAGNQLQDDGRHEFLDNTTLSLKERLIGYFECEKPYLSKNISMQEVAMRLFTNKSYLSKTINMEMNKNFRELVNYFRVKEAIKIFTANTDMSMTELRDRCGFNNNASFTSAFKLNTGYTPGEWCRDMKSRMTYEEERRKSNERTTQQ